MTVGMPLEVRLPSGSLPPCGGGSRKGGVDLPSRESRPSVGQQTRPSVLVTALGADLSVSPGSQRLSSSKGHNRREAATQRDRSDGITPVSRLLCRRDR